MTSNAEKLALKMLKEKHLAKWGCKLGYRKCNYSISDDCLETGREINSKGSLQWKGRMCAPCVKVKLRRLHVKRIERRGGLKPIGRPPLSASKKKKKSTTKKKL
jgi:hypothetical protein